MRFSEAGLTEGVEEHEIDGVPVRITNLARTVADCFKYRNKIGLDVAPEALKDAPGKIGYPASRVEPEAAAGHEVRCPGSQGPLGNQCSAVSISG